jgi:hypothetical protein
MSEIIIRCPKCEWEPDGHPHWYCDKCRHVWNTFETGGKCPVCSYVHKETICIACHVISPHADWYEWGDLEGIEEVEKEVVIIKN